jgi:hypothetical protein
MNAQVVKIRRATIKDAPRISELAQAVALQSIAAYTRLGFKVAGAMRDEKGVRFQPMTCPAKRLAATAAT